VKQWLLRIGSPPQRVLTPVEVPLWPRLQQTTKHDRRLLNTTRSIDADDEGLLHLAAMCKDGTQTTQRHNRKQHTAADVPAGRPITTMKFATSRIGELSSRTASSPA